MEDYLTLVRETSCGPHISAVISSNAWHVLREFSIFRVLAFLVKEEYMYLRAPASFFFIFFHIILQHRSGADLVTSHY